METTISADGTEIAFERTGSGPPLVLVYGNGDVHTFWELEGVRSALAEHCTVYVIERRGRGESGDADAYELEREAEDVAAVVDAIDEPVTLLGHSGGALYSLEAALRTDNLRNLILYEPPLHVGDHELPPEEVFAGMETLLDDGENEQALVSFLRDIAGLAPEEIDELRSAPLWQDMVDAAPVLPRELRAIAEYEFDAARFADVTTPTLLLSGGESLPLYNDATEAVSKALPDSRIAVFDGQEHMAMHTAPDRFIDEVLAFIRRSGWLRLGLPSRRDPGRTPATEDVVTRQDPLRALYRETPEEAQITDRAKTTGFDLSDPWHGTVEPGSVEHGETWPFGVHRAIGGHHDAPNPGDILCAALAACLDSTIRLIADRLGVTMEALDVEVTAGVDVRGTLVVKRDVPVGFQSMQCHVHIEPAEGTDPELVEKLLRAAEHSCVNLHTLRNGVPVNTSVDIEGSKAAPAHAYSTAHAG